MSTRNVPDEILKLVELVNADLPADVAPITVTEVQQFISGSKAPGGTSVSFTVPEGQCAVVVLIEQFNVDTTAAQSTKAGNQASGEGTTVSLSGQLAYGADVFYVFGRGAATFTFTATPSGGSYFARVLGYFVPERALVKLSRMATRIVLV